MARKSLFDSIEERPNIDSTVLAKTKSKKTVTTAKRSSGNSLLDKVKAIIDNVRANLGKFEDETLIIRDEQTLHDYISKCTNNGIVAVDTETTGLNPITDKIVGVCLYTPNEKTAYIPLEHINYITMQKEPNQLSATTVGAEMQRLSECSEIVEHNAKFDTRFMRHSLGVNLICTWDTYLASMLIDENLPTHALKPLHRDLVLGGVGDAFKYDELFKGVDYRYIPIKVAGLYAAHDPKITWELKEWQNEHIDDDERSVLMNIEMPCVQVFADLEDTGIKFDFDYNNQLAEDYHILVEQSRDELYKFLEPYSDKIAHNQKLDNPVNLDSPSQLSVLIYEVLGVTPVTDKVTKQPILTTGSDILAQLDTEFTKLLLEYRRLIKLVSTYIDKLPECVLNDGRIHCNFNQYGALTGRVSSSDPNMQNIPAHNKEIRQMFVASNDETTVVEQNNCFIVDRWCEVQVPNGWKCADEVVVGDLLRTDDGDVVVTNISIEKDSIKCYF